MASRVVLGCLGTSLVLLIGGCGVQTAVVTQPPLLPLERDGAIFVSSRHDASRIARSLKAAGLKTTLGNDARYVLRVEGGAKKDWRDCGNLRNVRYEVLVIHRGREEQLYIPVATARDNERPALEIKARGWTGQCEPSIYDDMSRALAREFRSHGSVAAPPPASSEPAAQGLPQER